MYYVCVWYICDWSSKFVYCVFCGNIFFVGGIKLYSRVEWILYVFQWVMFSDGVANVPLVTTTGRSGYSHERSHVQVQGRILAEQQGDRAYGVSNLHGGVQRVLCGECGKHIADGLFRWHVPGEHGKNVLCGGLAGVLCGFCCIDNTICVSQRNLPRSNRAARLQPMCSKLLAQHCGGHNLLPTWCVYACKRGRRPQRDAESDR
jgi:hypothetical protein